MGGLAVEFHRHAELPVKVVEVLRAGAGDYPGLTPGGRQPVGALDVADIAALQVRLNSLIDLTECVEDLASPAHPATCGHRCSQPSGGGEAPAGGAAQPAVGLIEPGCDRYQVQGGLLDASPGRQQDRVACCRDLCRSVDHYAGYRPWMASGRHRDVNESAGLVGQQGKFGRGVMAERRIRAGSQQRRGQLGLPWHRTRERRIHAPVLLSPSSNAQLVVDDRFGNAVADGLAAADDAALAWPPGRGSRLRE